MNEIRMMGFTRDDLELIAWVLERFANAREDMPHNQKRAAELVNQIQIVQDMYNENPWEN